MLQQLFCTQGSHSNCLLHRILLQPWGTLPSTGIGEFWELLLCLQEHESASQVESWLGSHNLVPYISESVIWVSLYSLPFPYQYMCPGLMVKGPHHSEHFFKGQQNQAWCLADSPPCPQHRPLEWDSVRFTNGDYDTLSLKQFRKFRNRGTLHPSPSLD